MANPTIENNDFRALVHGGSVAYDTRTVLSGESVSRGDVLGIVTASGKLKICDSGSSDGSQTAKFVAIKDTDASGGDVSGVSVLVSGEVNAELLTFGGTDTLADHFDELVETSIIPINTDKIGGQDNQ